MKPRRQKTELNAPRTDYFERERMLLLDHILLRLDQRFLDGCILRFESESFFKIYDDRCQRRSQKREGAN